MSSMMVSAYCMYRKVEEPPAKQFGFKSASTSHIIVKIAPSEKMSEATTVLDPIRLGVCEHRKFG
jgi:hypothetical protein